MTNNAIASTQKIGEGDAFLFDNSGATRNIEILAKQKASPTPLLPTLALIHSISLTGIIFCLVL